MDETVGTTQAGNKEGEKRKLNRHERRRQQSQSVQGQEKRSLTDLFKDFTADVRKVMGEVVEKHNSLAKQVNEIELRQQQIAQFAAQEFGKLQANQQMTFHQLWESFDNLDTNVVASGKIMKEIFGQLARLDTMCEGGGLKFDDSNPEELEALKKKAKEWFVEVLSNSINVTREEKAKRHAEEEAAHLARVEAAKAEAEKVAKDKAEAELAEKELKGSESLDKLAAPAVGGKGAAIPEGADVFGG